MRRVKSSEIKAWKSLPFENNTVVTSSFDLYYYKIFKNLPEFLCLESLEIVFVFSFHSCH